MALGGCPGALAGWWIRDQPGHWTHRSFVAAATFALKVKYKGEPLDMSSRGRSFNMSIGTLGGMPDSLMTSEGLKRNPKGTLAQCYILKDKASFRFSITLYTYSFWDILVNHSCIRCTGGRTKVSQIPGGNDFSILILSRISSVPDKCYIQHSSNGQVLMDETVLLFLFYWPFFFSMYLFYFWLHRIFVAVSGLSLVGASRAALPCGAQASHRSDCSCCRAQAPGCVGFSRRGAQA